MVVECWFFTLIIRKARPQLGHLRSQLVHGNFADSEAILSECRGHLRVKAGSVANNSAGGVRAGIRTRRNA